MIDPPQIKQCPEQLAALLHVVVPCHEIQHVMGPGLHELMEGIAAQGIKATGPWFAHHHRMPTDTFDFDIGLPVDRPVAAAGRMRPGALPAATVAQTVYSGPYEGLGGAWGEFVGWIKAQERSTAPDFWERYVICPAQSANPADWRTELSVPLTD
jgi:effector-binding domain-containing protein